jgi:ABC-type transport system involved in multi-copper enzyme maturation permease subunit
MSALVAWLRRTFPWSNSRQSWLDRLAVAGVLGGAVVLVLGAAHLSLAAQVLLWGLLLAAAAFTSRLFGPVLFYDLIRIARRNRYYLIRVLYAFFLLTMLCWVYLVYTVGGDFERSVPPNEAARFANSFFYMFMGVQFLVITVVTPAYVAGAIAEEKERKTLEFILATDLLNREIVLSKLASRVLNLMLLVLTGLPVLAGLQFLGGVDPMLVIAGFVATLLTVGSLAGLSILASVLSRRARDAIVLTYLMAAGYLALSGLSWFLIVPTGWATFPSTTTWTSLVTVQDLVEWLNAGNIVAALVRMTIETAGPASKQLADVLPAYLRNYALFHGAIALLAPLWSVLRLRAIALNETTETSRRRRPMFALTRRPRVGDQPMIWKEVFADRGLRAHWLAKAIVVVLILVSFVPVFVIAYFYLEDRLFRSGGGEWLSENTQLWVVRLSGTAVACLLLLAVAVRASSSISSERDRQTLDGLLTTPLDSNSILWGKWLGAILSVRRGWLWLGALWGIGVLTGGLHPFALILMVLTWLVYAAFLAGLGLWFSTVSHTTLRATTWTLLCTVGAAVGHWMIWMCCVPCLLIRGPTLPENVFEWTLKYQLGLTPMVNLGYLSSFRGEDAQHEPHLGELIGYGALGTITWGVLAMVMWGVTSQRFRQVAGRVAFEPERDAKPKSRARPRPRARDAEDIAEVLPIDPEPPASNEDEDRITGPQLP